MRQISAFCDFPLCSCARNGQTDKQTKNSEKTDII